MQSGKAVWPWVLGVVVIGGAGGWLFRDQLKHMADGVAVPVQSTPASTDAPPQPQAAAQPALKTTADQASAGYRGCG